MGVHGDPTPHPHHPVPAPGVPFALGALGPLPGDARDTGFLGDTRSSPLPGRRLPGRDKGPSVPGRGVARPALWAVRADGEREPRGPDGSVKTPALGAMGTLRKPPGDGSGPGLYILPPTVGFLHHDRTRPAGPAYTLAGKPSEATRQDTSPGPIYFLDPKVTRFGRSCTPAFSMQGRGKTRGLEVTPGPGPRRDPGPWAVRHAGPQRLPPAPAGLYHAGPAPHPTASGGDARPRQPLSGAGHREQSQGPRLQHGHPPPQAGSHPGPGHRALTASASPQGVRCGGGRAARAQGAPPSPPQGLRSLQATPPGPK
ncbi:protein CIMAP1D isoform X2 [Cavia porcellus]|uniref:protein CIMAP1D isoform X2 n=1 Tax=Cavia porcellus TaxID=10141 RepID=UPI002FE391B7